MRALLIPADSDAAVRDVEIDVSASVAAQFSRFRELVGGYVELVPFPGRSDVLAFVNEDGKRDLRLAVNDRASALLGRAAQLGDWIAGDCLLTGFDPDVHETIELPSDLRVDTLYFTAREGRLVWEFAPAATTARQTVTIIGPNLLDQGKGAFHVHAAGCRDIAGVAPRDPTFAEGHKRPTYGLSLGRLCRWHFEAASLEDIAAEIYSDIIAANEGATAADYLAEIHFAPCVTLPTEAPPTLDDDARAEIVEQCIYALSAVALDRLVEQGFDPENTGGAEAAIYSDVAAKVAPPALAAAAHELGGDWDVHGSDTIYLPSSVADRLLQRQGWIVEPVCGGGNAYVMPGRVTRALGGSYGTDYLWDRQAAIARAVVAEALR